MATDRRASALLRYCLRLWREGLPECIRLNHHLVNIVALRALKRADIETHTYRRDANEDHVSAALCASMMLCSSRSLSYFGATNWPWSQSIVALDCIGSPSFTAVLS